MYACLAIQRGPVDALLDIASMFSPHLERPSEDIALIAVYGLERLFGTYTHISETIEREAAARDLELAIAIASHPDTAMLAARHIGGVVVIEPATEIEVLGPLPIDVLPTSLDVLDTLMRWGVETLADFAALPPLGVIERLGEEGGRLQALVEGRGTRPLRIARPPEDYTARTDLDEPLSQIEPLLFIISGMVNDIVKRLASHGLAVGAIKASLAPFHEVRISFPAPVDDPRTILKQVHLELEAHRPRRAITAVAVELKPTPPRAAQHGLFTPPAAEPEQLQTLLARLRAIVGDDSAGAPELLNTHRPDAWKLRNDVLFEPGKITTAPTVTKVGFRYYRPALAASVAVNKEHRPARVEARGVRGAVTTSTGPWRSTGEWWTGTSWARDEWDIALDDGALYRLYREHNSNAWFVEGLYD